MTFGSVHRLSTDYTALYPWRWRSSQPQLWEPQILYKIQSLPNVIFAILPPCVDDVTLEIFQTHKIKWIAISLWPYTPRDIYGAIERDKYLQTRRWRVRSMFLGDGARIITFWVRKEDFIHLSE
jgi:hypothetical protein